MKSWAFACLLGVAAVSPVPRPSPAESKQESVLIPGGSQLREEPNRHSLALTLIDEEVPLIPLDRRGDWAKVAWRSWKGWVWLGEEMEDSLDEPPAVGASAEAGPLRKENAIALARTLLGPTVAPRWFGGYLGGSTSRPQLWGRLLLYTDIDDRELLARLEEVARYVEKRHRGEFFGSLPSRGTIVLFSRSSDQATFERTEGFRWCLGVAALAIPDRNDRNVPVRFAHELAHMLTNAHSSSIPPWLDEGIAENLSTRPIDAQGRVDFRRFTATARESIERLKKDLEARSIRLSALPHLPSRCVAGMEDGMAHPLAAMFVRFLVTGSHAYLARREFLAPLLAGLDLTTEDLPPTLGVDWPHLERDFARWLRRE
jgi:hypothetical protein